MNDLYFTYDSRALKESIAEGTNYLKCNFIKINMNRELYIQTVKKECAFLEQEGYSFNQVENNIYYTKNTDSEGYRIRFSWLEYGDSFVTYGLTAEIRFNQIEEEIQKVLGGELTNYYTVYKNPSLDDVPKDLEFTEGEKSIRFVSNTINDIRLFSEFVKRFYRQDVVSFNSSYDEFASMAIAYEKLEREEVSTLIINTGTDIFYRELVIKSKSNAIEGSKFAEMVINELSPLKDNSTFMTILNNIEILQKNLTYPA